MGSEIVDQIGPQGELVRDVDTGLSEGAKNQLLLAALPGARVESFAGVRVVRWRDQVILKAQVTHLGRPWAEFKKRIQIPRSWLEVERRASASNLVTRFVGIYHYNEVTLFVDFDPTTYVRRKANNSAAHVATNDLYQAQTRGVFSRVDRNGNHLTSLRSDRFSLYLRGEAEQETPRLDVFEKFNDHFLLGNEIQSLHAIAEMHAASWPDAFQGEWPGFYLEYQLDLFLREGGFNHLVEFRKNKRRGEFDYDLAFRQRGEIEFYGDLKASNIASVESPGNDAKDITRCIEEFGRFWYVIYEHETRHSRDNENLATVAWNEWKHSVGYRVPNKTYNPLSYAKRFKESVRFVQMIVLEVNPANFHLVLGEFPQGRQQSGASRGLKVMITKRNIDNFLVYSDAVDSR